MLNKKEAYLCLSAMLRAREPKLLNSERAERMLDAGSFEDAAKLLADCGYDDMSRMNAKEIEEALNAHRKEIYSELERLAPDRDILDIFRMKYDYHNAKVIIKSEAMNINGDALMSNAGRVDPAELKSLYNEEKYSSMPKALGKAIEEAKNLLARSSNPQQADFLLDDAYLSEMLSAAEESGNEFLKGYARILIDSANLKAAVRTLRMGKDSDFMSLALVKGGNVDISRILSSTDKESLAALFSHSKLEKAAQLGAEALEGGSLTAFELACDNAVTAYLSEAKLISYGSETLTAYLAALENEITAVRMILTGRLAGIKSASIKERLRDMYA